MKPLVVAVFSCMWVPTNTVSVVKLYLSDRVIDGSVLNH